MTVPTLEDHDVLLASGATTIGLNIAKDKSGNYLFSRKVLPVLSEQQFQTLGEQAFIPQLEQPFTQAEWHKGFGKQLYADKRYLKTIGTDASYKGMVIPSPVIVATTNSNPTQTGYNMGFENWTTVSPTGTDFAYLDNWSVISGGTANSRYTKGTSPNQGGSAHVVIPTSLTVTLIQPLGVTAVNNSIITFTVYAARTGTTDSPTIRLRILNGADAQLAITGPTGITTAADTYAQYTLAYTFTGTVSNPQIEIQVVTSSTDQVRVDTAAVAWTGTAVTTLTVGTIIKAINFNNSHYFVSDTGVWKRSAADLVWVGGSPPGITDAFVVANGEELFLCRGTSLVYRLMETSEAYLIPSTSGDSTKVKYGVLVNAVNYATNATSTLYKYSDIYTAATTATYTVGQSGFNVTALVNHLELATVVKENWAGYVNSAGTVIDIAQELASMFNANTGKNAISWRGNGAQTLYIPAGAGASLLAYDAGDVVGIGPDMFAERLGDFTGQIVATTSDDQWLYAILDNGAKIEIVKGRYETIDGVTDFRWHSIVEDTYTTVAGAHISSITAKRLYYWGGTALPKYIPLPSSYGDPLNDTNLTFLTGSTFETSWYDMGLKNVLKNLRSVALRSTALSGTARTIKVEYDIDDGNGWVELGGVGNGTFNTSAYQEKFFADGVEARYVKFRLTLNTDAAATGLGLLGLTVNYILNPTSLETWNIDVILDKNSRLLNTEAKDEEQTYPVVAAQLWNWKNTIPLTFTFSDGLFTATNGSHDGTTKKVRIAPNGLSERPITFARNNPPLAQEASFHIELWEVRTS